MQPFGRNRYGPKIGGCDSLGRGAGSPSNTMWRGPRPTCMPSFILIRPTVWPQYTNVTDKQTDRQDRTGQRTDSIGRTVLQTVAQKLEALSYISVAESLGISLTTFTQCAPNANEFGEIMKITATTPLKVIQGHRFWYQSKAHMRVPISD